MKTETINGIEYQIGKLPVIEQLHVGRRLAPLLAHAIPALLALRTDEASDESKSDLGMLILSAAAVPMADVLARMSNEDVEYVVKQCLDVCQRKQPKGWAKVAASGAIMFADIEADTVIALVKSVVEVSLGRFFPTGQSESPAPNQ